MPSSVTIRRPEGRIRTTVRLPRSKSVANRALILAALASRDRGPGEGAVGELDRVKDPGDADDTKILLRLLSERPHVMHCGSGGTTFRFLLAWACVQEGAEHLITGDKRLLERPHGPLLDALRQLGASIERRDNGFHVRGRQLNGGPITFDSPISSQFISAILLIAPTFSHELYLRWTGERLSEPYVAMTLKMLAHFGVVPRMELDGVRIVPSPISNAVFNVPPDWSAAAFWYQIAALSDDAEVLLEGLHSERLQGDERIRELLAFATVSEDTDEGVVLRSRSLPEELSAPSIDLTATPDLFQPLALTFAGLGWPANFFGLTNLAMKETDRVAAVNETMERLTGLQHRSDSQLVLREFMELSAKGVFETYGDHRMAMALATLALVCGSITIADPEVVSKSYPGFWEDLRKAGFSIEYHG